MGMLVKPLSGEGVLLSRRYGTDGAAAHYGPLLVEPDWSQVQLIVSPPGTYSVYIPQVEKSFEVWIGATSDRLDVYKD